jgi:ParB-like nuclease domain
MMLSSPSKESPPLPKLKLGRQFAPCPVEEGDEAYPNGIFEFNVSRLLSFIDAHVDRFPIEFIAVADIPDYGGAGLDEESVRSADLSRPILMAEIPPGRYNVIDGHHRIAKARRVGEPSVPARKIRCPEHIPFLTSTVAYEKYVEYWNSKLKEMQRATAGSASRRI